MDQETGSTAQAEPTTEAGSTSVEPVAVDIATGPDYRTTSFTPTKRPPFSGWVRRQTDSSTVYFVEVVDDIDTGVTVTEAELNVFYKKYGQILRGVKQKDQILALVAVRNNPGTTLTGYDKQTKTPQLSPITSADATGDSSTTFSPSER